jgi:mRNA-degrading endonuclease YafQ of YafQ-DinJ toxin-antitoxin module
LPRGVRYTNEFVARFRELSGGQRSLVEAAVATLISADDPTRLAHHLERRAYFCKWSHRVRSNLVVVFGVSRTTMSFLSTGTHSQAYRPKP